jgi:glutamate carboxypeptidase
MIQWRLEVRGTAAHSGLHYWEGRSALTAAARFAHEAESFSQMGGGPTVNVGRLVAGDASFVDDLAAAHELLGTERQLNVVPDRALAEGEVRFLRSQDRGKLLRRLLDLAEDVGRHSGTTLTFIPGPEIPPVDPESPHSALSRRAVELAADRGWSLAIETDRGGISFPNFLPDLNRIPILDGLGPVGGGMHTREEFVSLRSLRRRIVLLADLLAEDARGSSR